jgi:transposase
MLQEGTEQRHKVFAGSQIFLQAHPGTWPAVQIPAVVFDSMERRGGSAVYFSVLAVTCFHFMLQLITILNRCHRFPGFVYQQARFSSDHQSIEIAVRPRKGSKAVCSRCHKPAPGYDQLTERRFEFIPFWGFLVFLLYSMRRVDCRRCQAVVVEEVPWGDGKRTLTKAYMLFLARWARRLSWKETAESFRTSWDKVFDAVEHVVTWGLEHRVLGQIDAIGVDEIQYARGHKYLTLVYQIDLGVTRLLWIGKERTIESFQGFFTAMGKDVISKIVFVCSDMWEPYLKLIREHCSEALNILDRFHIVANMNKALDNVRAEETSRMKREGRAPVLRKSRWLLLRRSESLGTDQHFRLRDLLRYNLKTVRAYLLKEAFQQLWEYNSPVWAGKFLDEWCRQTMRSRIEPMKKIASSLRNHRELILNYFRAQKLLSSGVVEGLNNKAKVTMRRSYGFRTYRVLELALYHSLGKLPEPDCTHDFF